MPYPERPTELPLDTEECRTALWRTRGNISDAATLLKVNSARLRKFIKSSPYLSSELEESKEQLLDIAEGVVHDALTDTEDTTRQDQMARYILSSQGKSRGWGTGNNTSNTVNFNNFTVSWQDNNVIVGEKDPQLKVIDHV